MATNLSFMANVRKTGYRGGWNIEKARKFCDYLEGLSTTYGYFDADKAALATGMSKGGCKAFFKELELANENGMTLEEYFAKGRPYKYGSKVLA